MEPHVNTQPRPEHSQPIILVIVLRLLGAILLLDTAMALLVAGYIARYNIHQWQNIYVEMIPLDHAVRYSMITVTVVLLITSWARLSYFLSGCNRIKRVGLSNFSESIYDLSLVKSITVEQAWFGRWFNYGKIKLSYNGGGTEPRILPRNIKNPRSYNNFIDQHLQVQGWVR